MDVDFNMADNMDIVGELHGLPMHFSFFSQCIKILHIFEITIGKTRMLNWSVVRSK
jgi:hypothetical protein